MAVIVITSNPKNLLSALQKGIQEKQIVTWSLDADGDFTHATEQWRYKAWMRSRVYEDKLIFNILPPKGIKISKSVYAVYHGRLIEMLLAHFDGQFQRAVGTSMPTENDRIGMASP